ncbi:MAG: dihydrofolate reductase family protein [bacterium]|nr:dihydrofolate reductase family protein [bacterium]
MKVILYAAISTDGKIAEEPDQTSTDWTSEADYKWFVKQTKDCGVMVMGRKTFATINRPLKERLVYVMTRSPNEQESMGDSVVFTSMTPEEIVADAESRGYEKLALAGGSIVHTLFFDARLVDEVYLTVEPVIFGHGVPLVADQERVNLELINFEKLGEQAMLLHYSVKK